MNEQSGICGPLGEGASPILIYHSDVMTEQAGVKGSASAHRGAGPLSAVATRLEGTRFPLQTCFLGRLLQKPQFKSGSLRQGH